MQLGPEEIATIRLVLKRISFLDSLKLDELDELIGHMDKRPFKAGEVIIKQGDRGETFFSLASGGVGVFKDKFLSRKRISSLAPGSYFGELTVLDSEPRSASITCESAVRTLRLEQQDLYDLMRYESGLTLGIMSSLVGRIRLFMEEGRSLHHY